MAQLAQRLIRHCANRGWHLHGSVFQILGVETRKALELKFRLWCCTDINKMAMKPIDLVGLWCKSSARYGGEPVCMN